MYQVIARTWRPQKFSEVIGQKHVTQTLQNAIRLNRIGHGYIFSGQRGTGKTTLARLIAKSLNCHRGPAPEPCGECDSCTEIAASRSVDVIEIDAASNRGIDAVRELRENARYAPARDRYKVFIIDEAHQITTEGFNALLKILEEPPGHVIFLLATTEVHQFPETILSRCQHFSLHTLTFAEIVKQLEKVCAGEKVEADAESLAILAKSGGGSLRDALSRLEQAIAAFGDRLEGAAVRRFLGEPPSVLIEEVFEAIKARQRERMLQVVERLVDEGYQLTHFCAQLVRTARNLLVIRVSGPEPHLLETSPEETQRLASLAEGFTEESLTRCLEILLHLYQQLRFSMEPRFQMELGLLKLVEAERLTAIEELLARAENLTAQPAPTAEPAPQASRPAKLTPWEQDLLRKRQMPSAPPPEPAAHGDDAPASSPRTGQEARRQSESEPPASSVPGIETEISEHEQVWVQGILQKLEEQSRFGMLNLVQEARWSFGETEIGVALADARLAGALTEMDRKHLEQVCGAVLGRKLKLILANAGQQSPRERKTAKSSVSTQQPGAPSAGPASKDPEIAEFEQLFGKPARVIRNRKEQ
ncbi:MAG: DNA polymerase III subunit gamma/tau [Acidobacteria bacterium]|nr:DNA polymerase III subunit gamma/tau [Acidobacteriota bacterium]